MKTLQQKLHRLNVLFSRVTDWLLIGIGLALIVKAALAVDVPTAKYVIMGVGGVFVGTGFYYRHRRKQWRR